MSEATAEPAAQQHVRLTVGGMHCGTCAGRVERAVAGLPGVESASVNLASEVADLQIDPERADRQQLFDAIRRAGYRIDDHDWPEAQSYQLQIGGMTCAGCARRVQRALEGVPGVAAAEVNSASDSARVTGAPGTQLSRDAVAAAIREAGYRLDGGDLDEAAGGAASPRSEARRAERRDSLEVAAAVVLTLPLVAPMLTVPLGLSWHLPVWLQAGLAFLVQAGIGWRFYKGAWSGLKARMGNMEQLVALGTSAAFLYSLYLAVTQGAGAAGALYFEGAAAVVTLVRLGKWLEARAKRGTTAAVRSLMALRPETARRVLDDSGTRTEDIPAAQVREGDLLLVRPGERIPVDGTVESGQAAVDEAVVTGESVPVTRSAGADVTAGTVSTDGTLVVRATAVGKDTTLAKIGALVEAAQAGKAPIQRLVDRVAAVFVPTVIGISLATFLGWWLAGAGAGPALIAAVAVLVIACPCTLGLATPTAIVAGTGAAARAGILIKDVGVLERAKNLHTVVFDKTGTLTEGTPAVAEAVAADGDSDGLLTRLAAVQAGSEHPLARAVQAEAQRRGARPQAVEGFENRPGRGVLGTVGGRRLAAGNAALMQEEGVATAPLQEAWQRLAEGGNTVILVAEDGALAGLVACHDPVRPGAAEAVAALHAQGLRTALLSGDSREVAAAVAGRLGIDDVRAPVQPGAKAEAIAELRQNGGVAMVGDGVNDAPALAAADLGLAMGSGTDVALETAPVALMRADPQLVPGALAAARTINRKIKQNLGFAFVYNVGAIPLAAAGVLSPAIAGAAMAASSLSVVGNALVLRRWRPRRARAGTGRTGAAAPAERAKAA